jgi:hypothetical protein
VEGHCDALPDKRGYEIRLEGSRQPDQVMLDGIDFSDWHYEAEHLRTTIHVPRRDKGQPVAVAAIAEGGISALGEHHNRQIALADVRRLLAGTYPTGTKAEGLLDAVLHTEVPGRNNALARLDGPFVHFLEFTTPEEAAQQLGRVVVAAPARGEQHFDLEVIWRLFRSEETVVHSVYVAGATESQILNAPFSFDGHVQTMYWSAEVKLTWQGKALTYAHQSNLLFPSIYAWRAVVYHQTAGLTLEQVLDDEGARHGRLTWRAFNQSPASLSNVGQDHRIDFSKERRRDLQDGASLAAYIASTVICPSRREAILQFRSAGPVTLYMNGQKVEEAFVEQDRELPPLLRNARESETICLRSGANTLIVHSSPPRGQNPRWFFGGAFRTPDGDPMGDLAFE